MPTPKPVVLPSPVYFSNPAAIEMDGVLRTVPQFEGVEGPTATEAWMSRHVTTIEDFLTLAQGWEAPQWADAPVEYGQMEDGTSFASAATEIADCTFKRCEKADRSLEEGWFMLDDLHGPGLRIHPDGTVKFGNFENGELTQPF